MDTLLSTVASAIAPLVPLLVIVVELVIATVSGLGLTMVGAGGGAWILAGIVAGAVVFSVYRSRINPHASPNRQARKIGQLLVGLAVGFSIQQSNVAMLTAQLPVFGLVTLFLLVSGIGIGYLYSRLARVDVLTGILATVPGNIGIMASIAADYGKNTSLVSLVQLLRFTLVTFVIPLVAHVSHPPDLTTTLATLIPQSITLDLGYGGWLALVLAIATATAYIGGKLRIPVAAFLCPIGVGMAFNHVMGFWPSVAPTDFDLPPMLTLVGQILLGITIGEYWGANPTVSLLAATTAAVPVISTLIIGLASAAIAKLLTPWDWLTCLLVTAPGGSPEMIWIALAFNQDVEIVTTGHLIRLIAINLSLPLMVALANGLEKRQKSIVEPVRGV